MGILQMGYSKLSVFAYRRLIGDKSSERFELGVVVRGSRQRPESVIEGVLPQSASRMVYCGKYVIEIQIVPRAIVERVSR